MSPWVTSPRLERVSLRLLQAGQDQPAAWRPENKNAKRTKQQKNTTHEEEKKMNEKKVPATVTARARSRSYSCTGTAGICKISQKCENAKCKKTKTQKRKNAKTRKCGNSKKQIPKKAKPERKKERDTEFRQLKPQNGGFNFNGGSPLCAPPPPFPCPSPPLSLLSSFSFCPLSRYLYKRAVTISGGAELVELGGVPLFWREVMQLSLATNHGRSTDKVLLILYIQSSRHISTCNSSSSSLALTLSLSLFLSAMRFLSVSLFLSCARARMLMHPFFMFG